MHTGALGKLKIIATGRHLAAGAGARAASASPPLRAREQASKQSRARLRRQLNWPHKLSTRRLLT